MKSLNEIANEYKMNARFFSYPIGWEKHLNRIAEIEAIGFFDQHMQQYTSIFDIVDILQIKEKFGQLRIAYTFKKGCSQMIPIVDWTFRATIGKIEQECNRTCHACGEEGKPSVINNWMRVVCDKGHALDEFKYINPFRDQYEKA